MPLSDTDNQDKAPAALAALPKSSRDLPSITGVLASLGLDRLPPGEKELLDSPARMARMEQGALLVFRHEDLKKLGPDPRLINVPVDVYVDMYFRGPKDAPLSDAERQGIVFFQQNQVFTASPDVHRVVKPIVAKPFMPKALPDFSAMADAAALKTFDRFANAGPFDFLEDYGQGFAFAFWRRFFDMTAEETAELRGLMDGMAANGANASRDRAGLLHYNATTTKYIDLLVGVIRRARDGGKNPWLNWRAEQFAAVDPRPKGMPASAEHSMATDMIDGFHALGIAIGNCAAALFGDPNVYARLREDPDLLGKAVTEALRLYAPVRLISRYTLEDIEYDGMMIPARTAIWLYWGAGNRDPRFFAHPHSFDMMRSEPAITFGGGVQLCPGRNIGRVLAISALMPLLGKGVQVDLDGSKVIWQQGTPVCGEMVPEKVMAQVRIKAE